MLVGLTATHTAIATDALIMSRLRTHGLQAMKLRVRVYFWRENVPAAVRKAAAAGDRGDALPRPVVHEESVTYSQGGEGPKGV